MTTAADLVSLHLEACRFSEAAVAFESTAAADGARETFNALSLFGTRLLRLDLLDVALADVPAIAGLIPPGLVKRAKRLRFPEQAVGGARGALSDTPALFGQMLESFDVYWRRGDMLQVVAILHIVGEYVGHLAWHGALGHGADPSQLGVHVNVKSSRWGDVDSDDCGHGRPQRHLARRVRDAEMLRSPEAWARFLRSDYSRLGEQLLVCATRDRLRVWGKRSRMCEAPCPVWTQLSGSQRDRLERSVRIAVWFRTSPAVVLRHGAPVGHFFGVPDRPEVDEAWSRLADKLEAKEGVRLSGEDLPQKLSSLCGQIAGFPLPATTLVRDTVTAMRRLS